MSSSCAMVVGDVHGCIDEARDLLDLLSARGLDRDCELVLIGDLLDKGPDPVGVVRLFRQLREDGYRIVLCEGNHEEKHARWRRAEARQAAGGAENKMLDGSGLLSATTAALAVEDIAFLDSAVLVHEMPWADALAVHAGILPDLQEIPTAADLASMSNKERQRMRRMLRLRYWNPVAKEGRGAFVALGAEDLERDVWWADLYDGRFGHAFFGHEPFLQAEPPRWPHATGLDLGCVFGGHLAAAVIHGRGDCEFVTVQARETYAPARDEASAGPDRVSGPGRELC